MTQSDMFARRVEAPFQFNAEAEGWAGAQLDDIAESTNTKTRLKTVRADKGAYSALLQACCLVAWNKATAYAKARAGEVTAPLGDWVVSNPALAQACLALDQAGVTVSLVEMLPAGFDAEGRCQSCGGICEAGDLRHVRAAPVTADEGEWHGYACRACQARFAEQAADDYI